MEKDIILILGEGGMMGIFTAGALEVISKKLRGRIHSVYATSSGADVGAYFISNQTEVPFLFFTEHLTKKEFIRNNLISYIYKVFFDRKHPKIEDFINVEYVVEVASGSDCILDLRAFEASPIDFYVKVVNIRTSEVSYLPAKENLFQKLKATSQCGPFSTTAIEIGGEQYIDGGTIRSDLDLELVEKFKNKKFIYIESQGPGFLSKTALYPFYILAGCAIGKLYGRRLGTQYVKELFRDGLSRLRGHERVLFITNRAGGSTFCTDKNKLATVYQNGRSETEKVLR